MVRCGAAASCIIIAFMFLQNNKHIFAASANQAMHYCANVAPV
jgi:hypothetical protein